MGNRKIKVVALGDKSLTGFDAESSNAAALETMIKRWRKKLDLIIPNHPDLIIIPEYGDFFADWPPDRLAGYYRYRGTELLDFFSKYAKEHHCLIAASMVVTQPDKQLRFFNQMVLFDRNGKTVGVYNKNHPTIDEINDYSIDAGNPVPVWQTEIGRIAPVICFDLNFEKLCEHYASQSPDLVLFSSYFHGGLMQGFWAYRCQSFFIGAINAGRECTVLNPLGEKIACSTDYFPYAIADLNLDCRVVNLGDSVTKLNAAKAKYGETLSIAGPGELGCVLVTNYDENTTIESILAEFSLPTNSEYLRQSLIRQKASR